MATWPATLPQLPLQEGYLEQPADTLLRTPMEAGPTRTRRRFTAGRAPLDLVVRLTPAQLDTFTAWYETDLAGGALPFTWSHPRTGSARSFMFRAPGPQWSPATGGTRWRVALPLEALP